MSIQFDGKRYVRYACVKNISDAVFYGLDIFNNPRPRFIYWRIDPFAAPAPPYVHIDNTASAEKYGVIRAKELQKIPIILTLDITEKNFHLIQNRVWNMTNNGGDTIDYQYSMVDSYSELTSGTVCISLAQLNKALLTEFDLKVGVLQRNTETEFAYLSSEQFYQLAGKPEGNQNDHRIER